MNLWQSMETAPKDGSVIQLFDPVNGVVAGWWDANETRYPWRFLDRPTNHAAESIESNGFSEDYPPSGWQPLASEPLDGDAAPDLLAMLRLILPMAKGYAAQHPVGSNAAYIVAAEEALAKAELSPDPSPGIS